MKRIHDFVLVSAEMNLIKATGSLVTLSHLGTYSDCLGLEGLCLGLGPVAETCRI